MTADYQRCAGAGCDRPVTAGSPHPDFCSQACTLAYTRLTDPKEMPMRAKEFSAPEMQGIYETTARADGMKPLDFALPWLDARVRGSS